MGRLIARRLLAVIPLIIFVSLALFTLLAQVGNDKLAVLAAGGIDATNEQIEQKKEELGLNDRFVVQYGRWLGRAAHLDLGKTVESNRSVWGEVKRLLPVNLSMAGLAIVFGVLIGVPIGIISGLRPGTIMDRAAVVMATLGVSLPSFFIATLLITFLSVRHRILPPIGFVPLTENAGEWFKHLILPSLSLGFLVAAQQARQLRAGLIDVLGSQYVRTAWSKGSTGRRVVLKHALKNAAVPAITVLGLQFAVLLNASVVIERLFSIEGLGTSLLEAANSNDVTLVQGIVMVFVVITLLVNLLVDVIYGWLNPKVRLT